MDSSDLLDMSHPMLLVTCILKEKESVNKIHILTTLDYTTFEYFTSLLFTRSVHTSLLALVDGRAPNVNTKLFKYCSRPLTSRVFWRGANFSGGTSIRCTESITARCWSGYVLSDRRTRFYPCL